MLFVRKMIDQASAAADRAALFDLVGASEDTDPITAPAISDTLYYDLLEQIAQHEPDDIRFHLDTSKSMTCENYGAVGLAWKAAPTLRDSFVRMDRYSRHFNSASSFELIDKGDEIWWSHWRPNPARLGTYLSNEGTLATFVTLCREANGPSFSPSRVLFHHDPAGSTPALSDHFGCPVHYGADTDAIVITKSQAETPNLVGDESIWKFLFKHLDETLPPESPGQDLTHSVIHQVSDMLSNGPPSIQELSDQMGMSARTLQRRLADNGVTFQELVDNARKQLSEKLLRDTRYSLSEVAFLCGFSEQSAFSRAFKRWTGLTPGSFRTSLQTP